MKKKLLLLTLALLAGFLTSMTIYYITENDIFNTMSITLGTTLYHFAMRLTVGCLINAKYHNRMDPAKKWFQQRPFEPGLYKALRVKKWKTLLPTFEPDTFLLNKTSPADLLSATCQSEIVHEIIIPLSFAPLLLSPQFASPAPFLLTSILAALFDALFVIIQRYNRPRLIRFLAHHTIIIK